MKDVLGGYRALEPEAPSEVERCTEEQRCLARAIGYYVRRELDSLAALAVRGPATCTPPFRSVEIDSFNGASVVAPQATSDIITVTLPSEWQGVIRGIGWQVAFSGTPNPNELPESSAEWTALVNGSPVPPWISRTGTFSIGVIQLFAVQIYIPATRGSDNTSGSTFVLRVKNDQAAGGAALVASARVKGWRWPAYSRSGDFAQTKPPIG